MKQYQLFYSGKWKKSKSNLNFIKRRPDNSKTVATYSIPTEAEIDKGLTTSNFAQKIWQKKSRKFKFDFLIKVANYINKNRYEFAKLESLEVGKKYKDALLEIEHSVELWKYAASQVNCHKDELYENLSQEVTAKVIREPIGTVAVITPWNFPMIVLSERVPFILAAGCSVVIKPSEHASASILKLADFFKNEKKLSSIYTVFTGGAKTGEKLINSKRINMVSFTGSSENGKRISELCSKNLKKNSLELGGKNCAIVFDSGNLKKTCSTLVKRFLYNSSQACITPSKIFVQNKNFDKFKKEFIKEIKKFRSKDYGPISTDQNMNKIKRFYEYAKEKENIIYDGNKLKKKNYFEPVVLENVKSTSKIYDEEIFGPIIFVNKFKKIEELISKINSSKYGLACYLFSNDPLKYEFAAKNIECGRIWINLFEDYPQMTIGGYKQSGIGRESGSFGITNYSEIKSIIYKSKI